MKKKSVALILALALVVVCIVGGTLAWLTATTGEVKNTFTTSDINITLSETTGGQNHEFQMIPGYTITKDPKVTVIAGSEKCYLFVKLEKSANFDSFMSYSMAADWTPLTGVEGVYYRIVEELDNDQDFYVIANNLVTVSGNVTKKMMNDLTDTTLPTLTVKAYASQYMNTNTTSFTAAEAWANVNN